MLFKIPKEEILASNEMIESGAYFVESMKWYNDMFLSSFTSRIAYFVFFVTYGISVYLAASFGMGLFPLQETKQMIIFTTRDEDTYVSKKHLTAFDTPAKNILSIMIKNYVLQREQYTLEGNKAFAVIKQKNDFIKHYSSQSIFADFKDELNMTNGRGDRLMTDNTETKIQINSFDFIIDEESVIQYVINQFVPTSPPKSAKVEFIINGQKRVAVMSYIFDLPDSKAKGRNAEIKLTIIEYSVSRT